MRQGHSAYAGPRLCTQGEYLCLQLRAVFTPPWALLIQRLFHRLHDPPSWGRCPLQAVLSRWDRQLHTDPLHNCPSSGQLFVQTSADFFAKVPARSGLTLTGFNLAFIDGDHRFESVLNDFIALERHAAPGAVVLLHDTLPLTESTSGGERHTGFYSGDAWKIVPCLRALRPDLRLTTLPTAPPGLTVITGLTPTSTILQERQTLIHQVYASLPSAHAVAHPHALFNLGNNDPAWLERWLATGQ